MAVPYPPTPTSPIAPSPEAHLAFFRLWRSIRTQEGLRLGLPVLVAGMCVHTRVWMLAHTFVCGCPRSFSKLIPQFCPRVDCHRQEEEHLFILLLLYLKKPDTSRSAAARCWEHVRVPQGCSEGVPVRVSDRNLGCGALQGDGGRAQGVLSMLTTRPLCTGAESNRRDRVWGK